MRKLLLTFLAIFVVTVSINASDCILVKELNVKFKNGSTKFVNQKKELDKIRKFKNFIQKTNLYAVIEGYTNNLATAKYNYKLSCQRAIKVKNILQKMGLAKSHVKAMGFGETTPLYDNNTKEGLEKNRRVVAEVFNSAKEMKAYIARQKNRIKNIKFIEQ